MPEMLLHRPEVPVAAAEQLHATGVTEGMGVEFRHAAPGADRFGDFPDTVTLHPIFDHAPTLCLEA